QARALPTKPWDANMMIQVTGLTKLQDSPGHRTRPKYQHKTRSKDKLQIPGQNKTQVPRQNPSKKTGSRSQDKTQVPGQDPSTRTGPRPQGPEPRSRTQEDGPP
ncbi:hypothetical protein OTU49_003390, partial [Cherax quadricarinatus]